MKNNTSAQVPLSLMEQAATEIISIMKTPRNYLAFLVEIIQYATFTSFEGDKPPRNPMFEFTQIIDHVYSPWAQGGAKMVKNMAAGLDHYWNSYDPNDHFKILGGFFHVYAGLAADGAPSGKDFEMQMAGITALVKMTDYFYLHSIATDEAEKAKAKNNVS